MECSLSFFLIEALIIMMLGEFQDLDKHVLINYFNTSANLSPNKGGNIKTSSTFVQRVNDNRYSRH